MNHRIIPQHEAVVNENNISSDIASVSKNGDKITYPKRKCTARLFEINGQEMTWRVTGKNMEPSSITTEGTLPNAVKVIAEELGIDLNT